MEVSEVSLCYTYIIQYNYVETVILMRTKFVVLTSATMLFHQPVQMQR